MDPNGRFMIRFTTLPPQKMISHHCPHQTEGYFRVQTQCHKPDLAMTIPQAFMVSPKRGWFMALAFLLAKWRYQQLTDFSKLCGPSTLTMLSLHNKHAVHDH